jgi:hypothetical protein
VAGAADVLSAYISKPEGPNVKHFIVVLCAAVLLLCLSSAAAADPVVITNGRLGLSPTGRDVDGAEVVLGSDAFLTRFDGPNGKLLNDVCVSRVCFPGDVVNFSGSLNLNMFSVDTIINGASRRLFGRVQLALTTGDVTIADTVPGFRGVNLPVQRFTMQGRVSLDDATGATVLDTLVNGQGNVFTGLSGAQGDQQPPFSFQSALFVFDAGAPTPTPEPGTLLMVAVGLIAAATPSLRGRRDG